MSSSILCLDIGTYRLKAAVFDFQAGLLASDDAVLADGMQFPAINDVNNWLGALAELLPPFFVEHTIECIVISGNGPTLIALDHFDNVLSPILPWYDLRGEKIDDQPSYYLPQAAWFMKEKREELRCLMPLPEYIAHVLGAERLTILPNEDYAPYVWDRAGMESYGLPEELFPPLASVYDLIGRTSRAAEQKFSVPRNVPIICSGIDYLMSMVGTNALYEGNICDRSGTSEGINYCSSEPVPGFTSLPHLLPNLYSASIVMPWNGQLLHCLTRLADERGLSYPVAVDDPAFEEEKRNLFIYRQPRYEELESMLASYSLKEQQRWIGGMLHHLASSLGRSVDALVERGCLVDETIRICGGQCFNQKWMQYKADCNGLSLQLPEVYDAELLGSLCVALTTRGEFTDIKEAAKILLRSEESYVPQKS